MSEVIELEVARKNRLAAEHRASFGSWEDWSADEIMYLLRQLRDGHWENCGEPMEGFAIAVGGLSMAIDASEDEGEEAVRGVLNGIWFATDYMLGLYSGDEEISERAQQTIRNIWEATVWTATPANGWHRCNPFTGEVPTNPYAEDAAAVASTPTQVGA